MNASFTLFNETLGDARLSENLRQMRLKTCKENVRIVFDSFDGDKDGKLKFHETKYALKALGFELPNKEVLDLVLRSDPETQKYVSFGSFEAEALLRVDRLDPSEEVKKAFKELSQGTDAITIASLTQYTNSIDYPTTEEELKLLFETFDLDDDGRITFGEFLTAFDA